MKQSQAVNQTPIAITGIGCMFPKASDKTAYWTNIRNGRDCIVEIPASHWRIDDYYDPDTERPDHTYARTGGFLDPVAFDPMEFGISPNSLEAIDTSQLLTLLATRQALIDAGLNNGSKFDRDRVSVIMGVTGAQQLVIPLGARLYHPIFRKTLLESGLSEAEAEEIVRRINHNLVSWQEASFPGLLGNVVAGRIANRFDFGGSNCVVDAACAGSLASAHMACMELQTHRADLVVTGGVDTFNDIFMYMCFAKTKALSPTGQARPFDQFADGTTIGEGVGVITLKRLDDAERDGDTIYAVIRSIGTSSDGKGNAIYAPSAKGQKKALERAYSAAGITADTIGLVEAHGTGTPVGDAIELEALTDVFRAAGARNRSCALGSVKSQIGHGKAAAGVAGLIKTALSLHHRTIPPTIKVTNPQTGLAGNDSPFYLTTEQRPWVEPSGYPRRAAVSSFGFGGSNFHCVLEEHSATPREPDWDGNIHLMAFSGPDTTTLIGQLSQHTPFDRPEAFRAAAFKSRQSFDPGQRCRLLMVVTDIHHYSTMTATARDRLSSHPDTVWETPDGIFYGCGDPPGKLAAVFPGQGTQYPGMLRDMACRFPDFIDTLEQADQAFRDHAGNQDVTRLSDVIYPASAFSEPEKTAQTDRLKLTQFAQPGIGAVSIAAWQVLHDRFGLNIEASAGHSYGEICAMCASGMITVAEFHSLSSLRGRLMSAGDIDRGGMAAVQAPLNEITAILAEEKLDLVIANKNAPQQAVISGRSDEIARAVACFQKRKITITPLKVSAAFHSPLVADASKPFGQRLENIQFEKGSFPVYSNTTSDKYPAKQKEIRDILAAQLENPVEFVAEIQHMVSDGVRTFLEIGPGKRMTGLIDAIVDSSGIHRIALDASAGKRAGMIDLARTLSALSSLGYTLNLQAWDHRFVLPDEKAASRSRVEVMLTGTNYVREKPVLPPFSIQRDIAQDPGLRTVATPVRDIPASQAFSAIQANLTGLQRLQEQTAQLHQQFLTSQIEAQQAFQSLIYQQQGVITPVITSPHLPQQPPAATQQAGATSAGWKPARIESGASGAATSNAAPVQSAAAALLPGGPVAPTMHLLLEVVAAKTGYPADMLQPEMELDADLGIDSIKRVEIMSALQEKFPGLPPIGPEQLGRIKALNDIVALLGPAPAPATGTTAAVPAKRETGPATETHGTSSAETRPKVTPGTDAALLLEVVAEKTGYPVDLLELDMELDADLGIDSIKRVEILSALQEKKPGMAAVNPEKMAQIRTLQNVCDAMISAVTAAEVKPLKVESTRISPFDTKPISVRRAAESSARFAIVRDIIAVKTGYPADLLEPHMELDSDLGIDSIKRVEIMSAIQEKFTALPAIKPDQLATLRTIKDISDLVTALGGALEKATAGDRPVRPEPLVEARPRKTAAGESVPSGEKTRPATRPEIAVKPVGVTPASAPVKAAAEKTGVHKPATRETVEKPVTGRFKVKSAAKSATGAAQRKPGNLLKVNRKILGIEPFDGVGRSRITVPEHAEIWITRDDCGLSELIHEEFENRYLPVRLVSPDYLEFVELPDEVAGLIIVGPRDTCGMEYANKVFELIKLVGKKIRRPGTGNDHHPVVVSIVRLDGAFGLSGQLVDFQPMAAALSGLLKTIQLEWPETRCRVIDIDSDRNYQPDIPDLMDEFYLDGPFEMGISLRGKVRLELKDAPQEPARLTGEPLSKGDWILASGGARGVTAACVIEIARRFRVNVVLAGRSASPMPEPEWLTGVESEADIKQAILSNTGTKLTPRELGTLYNQHINNREILRNLDTIRAIGVEVRYEAIDLTDATAQKRMIDSLKRDGIHICGLIHGAGVIADKLIEEKAPEDFDRVIRTKVESLRYLSEHLEIDTLKVLVLFSSSTARFGRIGQVDYAMANEVLNKFAVKFSRLYPSCRTLAINWGPWDGGMVTPDLKNVFRQEGIEVIDLASGARFLSRELRLEYGLRSPAPVEIVALGSIEPDIALPGDLPAGEIEIVDQTMITETTAPVAPVAAAPPAKKVVATPPAQKIAAATPSGTEAPEDPELGDATGAVGSGRIQPDEASSELFEVFHMPLSPKLVPVLKSHLINGLPVVPMALLMEWSAFGALKQHPSLIFHGLENFRLLKGIVLHSNIPLELECKVGHPIRENRIFRVPLELRGIQPDGQKFVHVSTDVILVPRLPEAPDGPAPLDNPEPYPIHQGQIYHDVLFHGEELQSIRAVEGINESGISAAVDSAPPPAQWMQLPLDTAWVTDPMAIDAAFQLMILWTDLMLDMPSLPCGLKSYRQFSRDMPSWSTVEIRVRDQHGATVHADICFRDKDGKTVATIESYECITDKALREAFQSRREE